MKISIKKGDLEIILEPHGDAEYNRAEAMINVFLGNAPEKPARNRRSTTDTDLHRARAEAIEVLLGRAKGPVNATVISGWVKNHGLFTTSHGDPIHLVRRVLADARFRRAITGGFELARMSREAQRPPGAAPAVVSTPERQAPAPSQPVSVPGTTVHASNQVEHDPFAEAELDDPFADE